MGNIRKYNDFLTENIGQEKSIIDEINNLQDSIYDLFYQVYDDEGENISKTPSLNTIYKNLEPVITEGDDVGVQISMYVYEKMGEIRDELKRVKKILNDAKKYIKLNDE